MLVLDGYMPISLLCIDAAAAKKEIISNFDTKIGAKYANLSNSFSSLIEADKVISALWGAAGILIVVHLNVCYMSINIARLLPIVAHSALKTKFLRPSMGALFELSNVKVF